MEGGRYFNVVVGIYIMIHVVMDELEIPVRTHVYLKIDRDGYLEKYL